MPLWEADYFELKASLVLGSRETSALPQVSSWSKSPLYFFPYNGSGSAQLSLTSFETIVLDCNGRAVLSMCIKKNLSKLVNFCAAISILKMEGDT